MWNLGHTNSLQSTLGSVTDAAKRHDSSGDKNKAIIAPPSVWQPAQLCTVYVVVAAFFNLKAANFVFIRDNRHVLSERRELVYSHLSVPLLGMWSCDCAMVMSIDETREEVGWCGISRLRISLCAAWRLLTNRFCSIMHGVVRSLLNNWILLPVSKAKVGNAHLLQVVPHQPY